MSMWARQWPLHRMPYRIEGPHMSTVSEAVARPVRTGIQLGTAGVLTEFTDAFIIDMTDRQYLASAALLTLVLSWIQALVENRAGVGLLRNVPPRKVPVVDDKAAGHADTLTVVLIAAATTVIVLAIFFWVRL